MTKIKTVLKYQYIAFKITFQINVYIVDIAPVQDVNLNVYISAQPRRKGITSICEVEWSV